MQPIYFSFLFLRFQERVHTYLSWFIASEDKKLFLDWSSW